MAKISIKLTLHIHSSVYSRNILLLRGTSNAMVCGFVPH